MNEQIELLDFLKYVTKDIKTIGIDESLAGKITEEKFAKLSDAYDNIKKERGIK